MKHRKALVILSHELLPEQVRELEVDWKVSELLELPTELKSLWANIPPELESVTTHIDPIISWMEEKAEKSDVVVVQGDYGATFAVVCSALDLGLIPVYATTKRVVEEIVLPDGSVEQRRTFKHVRFRIYISR